MDLELFWYHYIEVRNTLWYLPEGIIDCLLQQQQMECIHWYLELQCCPMKSSFSSTELHDTSSMLRIDFLGLSSALKTLCCHTAAKTTALNRTACHRAREKAQNSNTLPLVQGWVSSCGQSCGSKLGTGDSLVFE